VFEATDELGPRPRRLGHRRLGVGRCPLDRDRALARSRTSGRRVRRPCGPCLALLRSRVGVRGPSDDLPLRENERFVDTGTSCSCSSTRPGEHARCRCRQELDTRAGLNRWRLSSRRFRRSSIPPFEALHRARWSSCRVSDGDAFPYVSRPSESSPTTRVECALPRGDGVLPSNEESLVHPAP